MRSSLRFPLRYEGRVVGGLGFHSREPFGYSLSDVVVGRRLADHVAVAFIHQRLADESRRAAELQERAASLEMLDGLMPGVGMLDRGEQAQNGHKFARVPRRLRR